MTSEAWRFAFASVIGTSHVKSGAPCQDSSDCRVLNTEQAEPVLVAVASDGAGSAEYSGEGSQLACELLMREMESFFACGNDLSQLKKQFIIDWLELFQNEIALKAEDRKLRPRDFACTILAAIVGTKVAVFFQVGDGAIIASDEVDYNWVFWPNKGEYENTTYFATESHAATQLEFDLVHGKIDEIALFTDGIQHLALHYQSQSAHSPFFTKMFHSLRSTKGFDQEKMSVSLALFLNSDPVNQRTDDDKTLVLATRRGLQA